MREIKFRAWDKENKVLLPVDLIGGVIVKIPGYEWENVEDFEIMQYTGLKDKNGKEVYEGDVYLNPLGNKLQIIFSLKEASFTGKSLRTKEELPMLNFEGQLQGEVIGNIYDNPELLRRDNIAFENI